MLTIFVLALLSSVAGCLSVQHIAFVGHWPCGDATSNARVIGRFRGNGTALNSPIASAPVDVCVEDSTNITSSPEVPVSCNGEKTLYLLDPRGFCAGVRRAIQTVEEAVRIFGPPIYVKHEIVHNEFVCNALRVGPFLQFPHLLQKKGVVFIEDIETVPEGSVLILSAHGVPPSVREQAQKRNLVEIDASCPLVNKVHVYVKKKAEEGYKIVLIGHNNHVETIGTKGEAPEVTKVVETVADVDKLDYPPNTPLFYATQTTLSVDDCQMIKDRLIERFPWIETIPSGSICYATTNRQFAVREACKFADLVLIVGSMMSSNANRLVDTAKIRNVRAYLVPNAVAITPELIGDARRIALSASASTPDDLTFEVADKLGKPPFNFTINLYNACEEKVPKWRLPRNLETFIKEHDAKVEVDANTPNREPPVTPGEGKQQ
ncbi:4-hydroxy-3-methylbut-2-enyl diphosphate reductase [Babesia ovis]|uniref:4-hydroxy-3-methylbut-2-enyl diphosphate reductase n=1 Tax=Babesia ovis TaxID=5869 RepID=A0A9W5T819_BABOV|nr:4-hydroxy-3-methylbut-2-enyl diphosphate reductase [Babesia ovis]